jgi:hypothetical protein
MHLFGSAYLLCWLLVRKVCTIGWHYQHPHLHCSTAGINATPIKTKAPVRSKRRVLDQIFS